jgi:N-hydroxyarylamine O-acetyltransferase
VGFGEFAFQPLRIELNKTQEDERGSFSIEKYDDEYYEVSKLVDENWMTEYRFSLRERDLSEFQDMCLYHQTSPHSHFTQNKLCSLATEKGRITVTADKIKIKEEDTITELPVHSEEEFLSALKKYFNIRLHENVLSQPA